MAKYIFIERDGQNIFNDHFYTINNGFSENWQCIDACMD